MLLSGGLAMPFTRMPSYVHGCVPSPSWPTPETHLPLLCPPFESSGIHSPYQDCIVPCAKALYTQRRRSERVQHKASSSVSRVFAKNVKSIENVTAFFCSVHLLITNVAALWQNLALPSRNDLPGLDVLVGLICTQHRNHVIHTMSKITSVLFIYIHKAFQSLHLTHFAYLLLAHNTGRIFPCLWRAF